MLPLLAPLQEALATLTLKLLPGTVKTTFTSFVSESTLTEFFVMLIEYEPLWVAVYEAFVALAIFTPSLFHWYS
jgi:hypothetical protein